MKVVSVEDKREEKQPEVEVRKKKVPKVQETSSVVVAPVAH
jgi:hypothetical protein